jgi:hypothetical protein
MINSRRMRWVRHMARGGEMEVYTWFWYRNLQERNSLKEVDVERNIILRRILKKKIFWEGVLWLERVEDRNRYAGCCEYGDELSGSIKY